MAKLGSDSLLGLPGAFKDKSGNWTFAGPSGICFQFTMQTDTSMESVSEWISPIAESSWKKTVMDRDFMNMGKSITCSHLRAGMSLTKEKRFFFQKRPGILHRAQRSGKVHKNKR